MSVWVFVCFVSTAVQSAAIIANHHRNRQWEKKNRYHCNQRDPINNFWFNDFLSFSTSIIFKLFILHIILHIIAVILYNSWRRSMSGWLLDGATAGLYDANWIRWGVKRLSISFQPESSTMMRNICIVNMVIMYDDSVHKRPLHSYIRTPLMPYTLYNKFIMSIWMHYRIERTSFRRADVDCGAGGTSVRWRSTANKTFSLPHSFIPKHSYIQQCFKMAFVAF